MCSLPLSVEAGTLDPVLEAEEIAAQEPVTRTANWFPARI